VTFATSQIEKEQNQNEKTRSRTEKDGGGRA